MDAIAGDPVSRRNAGAVRDQGAMSIQSIINHDDITTAFDLIEKKIRARQGTLVIIAECVLTDRSGGNGP
jgi:hypothetical protein